MAPGCYRVGPSWFRILWIAANELPLRDELVPFLLSRTGRALDRFAVWVATRRPLEWVMEMVHCLKVSPKVREDLRRRFARSDEPEVAARQMETLDWLLSEFPEKKTKLVKKGSRAEARKVLRRVLARRSLVLEPEQDARIDACKDIATLERWIDEAVTAASVTEVFT